MLLEKRKRFCKKNLFGGGTGMSAVVGGTLEEESGDFSVQSLES